MTTKVPPATKYTGRHTVGWIPGEKITSPEQVNAGDVLFYISHQFKAKNLVRVRKIERTPSDGFCREFVDTEGTPTGEYLAFTWWFQLEHPEREFFRAIRLTEVSEAEFDDMLGAVPPRSRVSGNFLVGEPKDTDNRGRLVYQSYWYERRNDEQEARFFRGPTMTVEQFREICSR